jgi:hypothetical protein
MIIERLALLRKKRGPSLKTLVKCQRFIASLVFSVFPRPPSRQVVVPQPRDEDGSLARTQLSTFLASVLCHWVLGVGAFASLPYRFNASTH